MLEILLSILILFGATFTLIGSLGLIRLREFTMKDAYSLDTDADAQRANG